MEENSAKKIRNSQDYHTTSIEHFSVFQLSHQRTHTPCRGAMTLWHVCHQLELELLVLLTTTLVPVAHSRDPIGMVVRCLILKFSGFEGQYVVSVNVLQYWDIHTGWSRFWDHGQTTTGPSTEEFQCSCTPSTVSTLHSSTKTCR